MIATKYMFRVGFAGMAAGILYFVPERRPLAARAGEITHAADPTSVRRHLGPSATGRLDAAAFIEPYAVQREGAFVGLAALTLPHGLMLLRLRYLQRRSPKLSSHPAH